MGLRQLPEELLFQTSFDVALFLFIFFDFTHPFGVSGLDHFVDTRLCHIRPVKCSLDVQKQHPCYLLMGDPFWSSLCYKLTMAVMPFLPMFSSIILRMQFMISAIHFDVVGRKGTMFVRILHSRRTVLSVCSSSSSGWKFSLRSIFLLSLYLYNGDTVYFV